VTVPDIFRRPGNPSDSRKLIKRLVEGKPVSWAEYNFYTLASVIKVRQRADRQRGGNADTSQGIQEEQQWVVVWGSN